MPNWCHNKLIVEGPAEDLRQFLAGLESLNKEGETSILRSYFPMPKVLEGTISGCATAEAGSEQNFHAAIETGYKNWYDWCSANWGTKWPDRVTTKPQSDEMVEMYGDTAWGPPISGYDKVFTQFPSLKFTLTYNEPGMGFGGRVVWEHGQMVDQEEWEEQWEEAESDDQ